MRIHPRAAALAAWLVMIGLAVASVSAAPPPTKAKAKHSPYKVAFLDLTYIYKHHAGFLKRMEAFHADVTKAESEAKNESAEISKLSEQQKALPAGSEQAAELQAQIARRSTELKIRIDSQRTTFTQRESQIYDEVHQQVVAAAEKYAKAHHLTAVLRVNSVPGNSKEPQEVVRGINQEVVWADKSADITPIILKEIENQEGAVKPNDKLVAPEIAVPVRAAGGSKSPSAQPAANQQKGKPSAAEEADDDSDIFEHNAPAAKEPNKKGEPATKATSKTESAKVAKSEKTPPKETVAKAAKKKVVRLTLKGAYPEGPSQQGLFAEMQPSLAQIVERLDDAAADKSVDAVWLRIEDLELGRGKLFELRAAIARVHKAGKPICAELASAEPGQYLVASACDEVYMSEGGMLVLPGVRTEVTFYKGLMEKVGVEFDALKMGKYKGFVEPYTLKKMSGPLRESMEAIVDDLYRQMVGTIAADRHLKPEAVRAVIDRGFYNAAAAKKAGLVNDVLYGDQIEDLLRKKLNASEVEVVTNYKKKQVDTDFSGMGGLMKLMELFSGNKPAEKAGTKSKIAVVYAVGAITEGKSASDMWGSSSIGSTTMVETIHKAVEDPKVVAMVLRVDSPGGSATASDLIWREIVRSKKPVVASMGDVAGSGGYYIAMGARRIFASPGTITGSIGVFGGKLVTHDLYDKLGLTTEVISRGKNAGSFSSNQRFSDSERKVLIEVIGETYQQFVAKAANGRKMDPKKLEALAQGRIYTGDMAKANGLIDEVGTLRDAITAAKKLAGLKADADVELLILPRAKTVFEQLFGDNAAANDLESAAPEVFQMLRQTRLVRGLFTSPVLLWMPYEVRVR